VSVCCVRDSLLWLCGSECVPCVVDIGVRLRE